MPVARRIVRRRRGGPRQREQRVERRILRSHRRRRHLRVGQHDVLARPHRLEAGRLRRAAASASASGRLRPHVDAEQSEPHGDHPGRCAPTRRRQAVPQYAADIASDDAYSATPVATGRRASAHARIRRRHARVEAPAVGVGGRASRRQPELLGGHGRRLRPAARTARVGRVGRRRAPVRVLVWSVIAQGEEHRRQPGRRRRQQRHRRVRLGRGGGGDPPRRETSVGSDGSSATSRNTSRARRRWPSSWAGIS